MQQTKHTLIGARNVRLRYTQCLPPGTAKAIAVLVHGYGEHTGRYRHVIEAMAQRGYAVYSIDHRGHGESRGVRAHVERFEYFVTDLRLLVERAHAEHSRLPMFMIGHSMGGLIATLYALQYQTELTGLVLSGAALRVGDDVSPLLKRMSRILATIVPRLKITTTTRSTQNVLGYAPELQEQWDSDPLCYQGKLRARLGYEFLKASTTARAHMQGLTLPLLIMHGAGDLLIKPIASEELYAVAESTDKTLKLWPNNGHLIFDERDKADVIATMLDWMDQRLMQHAVATSSVSSTTHDDLQQVDLSVP